MNYPDRLTPSEVETYVARAHHRAAGTELGDIRINILIRLNNSLMMDLLNRGLAPYEISNVGYFAMVMLYSTPDNLANPSEICNATGETRANMTRICDDLVTKGLMQRVTSPDDRRRVNLSLTDAGIALLQTMIPELQRKVKDLFSSFSEAEKASMVKLLTKLNTALESYL